VTEVNEVKSRKSQKYIYCHTDNADYTDLLFKSRRNGRNSRNSLTSSLLHFTSSSGLFGFEFFDFAEEMAEDVGRGVGMGLAEALGGITVVGVAGDDKEGYHEIGICGGAGLGLITQPLTELSRIGITRLCIVEEVGTEQHEGGEAPAVVLALDGDAGIAIHTCHTGDVMMGILLRDLTAVLITQDIDHLLLEVLQEMTTEEAFLAGIIEDDITLLHIGEVDTPLVIGNIDTHGHIDLALLHHHLRDGAFLTYPRLHLHTDRVAHRHLIEGMTEEELQLAVLDGLTQQLHLGGGDLDGLARMVAVVIETQARPSVPVGLYDTPDALLRGFDEHKAMELTTDIGIVGQALHHQVGDEVLYRLGGLVTVKQGTIVLLLQHDVYLLGLEVNHYIPRFCHSFIVTQKYLCPAEMFMSHRNHRNHRNILLYVTQITQITQIFFKGPAALGIPKGDACYRRDARNKGNKRNFFIQL